MVNMDEQIKEHLKAVEKRIGDQEKRYDGKIDELVKLICDLKEMSTSRSTEVFRENLETIEHQTQRTENGWNNFNGVCKSWRSHISNPEFVKRHVLRTRNNPDNDLFIVDNSIRDASRGRHTRHFSVINVNFLDRAINLNIPIHDSNDIGDLDYVVGSCNGLLCLAYKCKGSHESPHKLYLWNLATTQVKDRSRRYTIEPHGDYVFWVWVWF
ncbi:hypothetical protein POM88_002808 [Heracleum sosnowskyi]|uniref:Uncharacterized protein n=1 Tax=Heracleum sosnowskyi TaxID=360622 RepID=A0AAD8NCY1_9APIA|nr:hypothetical protein POM88_002808 [Heracleum sosnowskyi]